MFLFEELREDAKRYLKEYDSRSAFYRHMAKQNGLLPDDADVYAGNDLSDDDCYEEILSEFFDAEAKGNFPAPGLLSKLEEWFSDHPQALRDVVEYLQIYVDGTLMSENLKEANVKGREVDLTTKEKTIAYALRQPDNSAKLEKILNDVASREISFSDGVRKCQELINSLENVSDQQKKNAYVSISHARTPNHLMSMMGTYITGDKVITGKKSFK